MYFSPIEKSAPIRKLVSELKTAQQGGRPIHFLPLYRSESKIKLFEWLDVHDMEDLGEQYVGYDNEAKSTQFGMKSLRLGRKLEPGFVLTIEPGIYFIPELIDLWQKEKRFNEFLNYDKINEYRNFGGLRNEEDFLITKTGARLLGKQKAKTIDDVEGMR